MAYKKFAWTPIHTRIIGTWQSNDLITRLGQSHSYASEEQSAAHTKDEIICLCCYKSFGHIVKHCYAQSQAQIMKELMGVPRSEQAFPETEESLGAVDLNMSIKENV